MEIAPEILRGLATEYADQISDQDWATLQQELMNISYERLAQEMMKEYQLDPVADYEAN